MIGYFGKLPGSADFIGHNATLDAVREFDDWLQRGLASWIDTTPGWQARFDALPLCYFHYRARSGHWLIGGWISSRDASGRRYPLIIFQHLRITDSVEGSLGVHTLSELFAAQLRRLLVGTVHGEGRGELTQAAVEAIRSLNDADFRLHRKLFSRFLDDVRYADLAHALAPGFPEFVPSAFALRMQALREQLCNGRAANAVLPLPAEHALKRPAADLWLHWLERGRGSRARASVLVDHFMRPRLLRFARCDDDLIRAIDGLLPRARRFDVLEAFDDYDPRRAQAAPPDDRLGMGIYVTRFPGEEGSLGNRRP